MLCSSTACGSATGENYSNFQLTPQHRSLQHILMVEDARRGAAKRRHLWRTARILIVALFSRRMGIFAIARLQDEITTPKQPQGKQNSYACIGVDKFPLDVSMHPANEAHQFGNDTAGLRKLVRYCKLQPVQLIALEATKRCHRKAHEASRDMGFAVACWGAEKGADIRW